MIEVSSFFRKFHRDGEGFIQNSFVIKKKPNDQETSSYTTILEGVETNRYNQL
jgi:hypothetical protein